ncbi:viroplasmin family protein [Saccharicrinis sp. FJH2]|uniref:ribonuclease H1 domain-containing protein n=1 Tax=Saccharicrinis sp. FJH65 TaxID=3344659 RepID=UPI0035F34D13
MGKSKNNYYVVWVGNNPGIYDSWEKCKAQVHGFEGAKYKGFKAKNLAEKAFEKGPETVIGKKQVAEIDQELFNRPDGPTANSIAVDAACSGNPGKMEYRGVYTYSGTEIFRQGPHEDGTNNIGEFLALVHALAWLKQQKLDMPVYTDSKNALAWIRNKRCNTKLVQNSKNARIFELIKRAEIWLRTNKYETKILKWDTRNWGEIPADFGRK